MTHIFRSRYFIGFVIIWAIAVAILHLGYQQPLTDSLPIAFIFGCVFPVFTWLLVLPIHPPFAERVTFSKEIYILIILVLMIVWYISYGTGWINSLVSKDLMASPEVNSVYILLKKLLIFCVIPFITYRGFGFRLKDFGFSIRRAVPGFGRAVLIFVILSAAIILFQFYFGHGAEPMRNGQFTKTQLWFGLPLCFFWYFIEVGLVEEFFFRALLQSRIAILLKSNIAGILISGLIFGLVHAPGLYLRGASSEGIREQLPFIFWAAYTVTVMSLAGIFLGILWSKTRNIYLVMAIHAMVDLVPNVGDFVQTWGIK